MVIVSLTLDLPDMATNDHDDRERANDTAVGGNASNVVSLRAWRSANQLRLLREDKRTEWRRVPRE